MKYFITRTNYILLLLLLTMAVTASLQGQDLEKKITIQAKEKPLGEVLSEIAQKGNILFSYSSQSIPVSEKVTLSASNQTVRFILNELLTPLKIHYTITENQVILKPAKASGASSEPPVMKKKYTLSGYVKDESSGEVLIGANVYDKSSYLGTTTNAYGFFSITLPEGNYRMVFSLIGYHKSEQDIQLTGNRRISAELRESSIQIGEVEIVSKENTEEFVNTLTGFSNSTLRQLSGLGGNIDVVRSIQSVPGINSFGDGSTFYYVRGGNNDQNLLMIDDAPIYNPSHLFGFFSALSPDAIKDVKTYKGDFPANYGGRLSSVVDIRARDGNMKRFGVAGSLGPYTSDLTFEGPIIKEKSSFIISGRRSNLNWLSFKPVEERTSSILFYDFNAKLNVRINENNRLFLTGFVGNDDFSWSSVPGDNSFGIQWKNAAGTLRWNHIYNNRLFSNTIVSFSRYDYFLFISRKNNEYWTSAISNGTIKTDFSWFPNPKNTVKSGIAFSNHHSNPGNIILADKTLETNLPKVPQYNSLETVLYASNEQKVSDRWTLNYGVRLTSWRDLGPTTVYLYDGTHKVIDTAEVASQTVYEDFINLEPRLTIRYDLTSSVAIRGGYSRTVQYLQMLSNSISPFTSLEVWAASGPRLKPQKSDHTSIGVFTEFGRGWSFSTETYYKVFYNQIDYKDHANMLYNPLIEGELRFGTAHSKGIEFLIRKSEGKLTGWIGYSLSKVTRKTEGVNNNDIYVPYFDRPHSICLNLSYRSGNHWDFSINWFYLSGAPFSSPTGFYRYNGYVVPVFGEKNNDRLPDYHRMDVSITCWLNKPSNRFKHSLALSIYNFYGRNNPYSVNFNKIMDDQGKFYIPSDLEGNYEIIPTQISVAGVLPSLNYNFRF